MTHFAQIVTKHLGDFCMNIGHRELSKIAQSGHTGVRVRGVQKVALLATRVLVRNREREQVIMKFDESKSNKERERYSASVNVCELLSDCVPMKARVYTK